MDADQLSKFLGTTRVYSKNTKNIFIDHFMQTDFPMEAKIPESLGFISGAHIKNCLHAYKEP